MDDLTVNRWITTDFLGASATTIGPELADILKKLQITTPKPILAVS